MGEERLPEMQLPMIECSAMVSEVLELMAVQSVQSVMIRCPNDFHGCSLSQSDIVDRVARYGQNPADVAISQVFDYDHDDGVERPCRLCTPPSAA